MGSMPRSSSPELQRRILAFERSLDVADYFQILGVERGVDVRAIKRAYFGLSKEYHPDRYFRRDIGDFGGRLERIFKRVVEAYELLSDPTTRAEIERTLPHEVAPQAGAYRADDAQSDRIGPDARKPRGYRKPSRLENLERLRRRFKMPKKLLAEREFKARQFFQAAQVASHQDNFIEAAASARLAIAFDPWNAEYKNAFAEIQGKVHGVRAARLLEQASDAPAAEEALRMLEEALAYRPCDPEVNARAAKVAIEVGELEKGLEYAENACELEPERAAHHALVARAERRLGRPAQAAAALNRGVKLDATDPEVVAEGRQLRRRALRGGRR